ncbi:hypothetical protein Scep_009940 [Stephania cephalantha]|uniref:Uncharacterized protein n=1 Tax=Stephania cephalantha TaxID=152367 RepID=A0AAP0PES1_9MAGN
MKTSSLISLSPPHLRNRPPPRLPLLHRRLRRRPRSHPSPDRSRGGRRRAGSSEVIESKVPTIESEVRERSSEIPTNEIEVQEMGCVENDERSDGLVAESVSSEEKLEGIRGGVMEKIGQIRGLVSEVSKLRKEVARKKRKAAKNVNLSAVKYRELDEACEVEDFERADRVSERLSEVEKERCNL